MLLNPCNIAESIRNTGVECSDSLKASIGIIMVPKSWKDTLVNIQAVGFTEYANTKIHAAAGQRWLPIGGQSAPFRDIKETNENDILETLPDGSTQFIRYGKYNRTFVMTDGGLCLAGAIMAGFRGNNYSFIEIDITGQVALMDNGDGTFSGFPVNLAYAPAPMLANLQTSFKNQFMLSFNPETYIIKGHIFGVSSDEDPIGLMGLIDTGVYASTTTQTTTNIYVKVKTLCAEEDLSQASNASDWAVVGNFVIKKKSDGTVVTPSAVLIVGTDFKLTGTYITATDYTVALAPAATLLTNNVDGYDGVVIATVSIP